MSVRGENMQLLAWSNIPLAAFTHPRARNRDVLASADAGRLRIAWHAGNHGGPICPRAKISLLGPPRHATNVHRVARKSASRGLTLVSLDDTTEHPVIDLMLEQRVVTDTGGTMRRAVPLRTQTWGPGQTMVSRRRRQCYGTALSSAKCREPLKMRARCFSAVTR